MQKALIIIGIIFTGIIAAYAVLSSGSEETTTAENVDIDWHTELKSALAEAQNTDKPVFVDFYTTWCYYCKELDETTFSDPRVQEKLAKNYVVAKIDADKNSNLASNYGIYGYPTLLILNSNGQEINRIEGYVDADNLLNQI